MPPLKAPTLMGYDTAIQANQSMSNAFKQLSDTSQNYLNYSEQQKQNALSNAFNEQKLGFERDKYNTEMQDKANSREANAQTMKMLYPNEYDTLAGQYGGFPSKENASKFNGVMGSVNLGDIAKVKDFDYRANKDQKDFEYKAKQDGIQNGFERERIGISRANSGKPTETERLLSIIMGGGVPKETIGIPQPTISNAQPNSQQPVATVPTQNNTQSSLANITSGIKTENKPISQVDIITSKNDTKFTDKDGRVWGRNPITKREYLVEDAKPKEISMSDIEDINKSIEMANSLSYAKDKYNPSYTGMIDDRINFIKNKIGDSSQETQDYNKWAASLQSVGNAARNKSFGAALSGFDINEFAKEFPSTDAGDGTIMPKLEVRSNMLKNSLSNTYNAWVDKYGKERADQYFSKLSDQSVLGKKTEQSNSSNVISDEEILKKINGGK